jgi:hypothetical protein
MKYIEVRTVQRRNRAQVGEDRRVKEQDCMRSHPVNMIYVSKTIPVTGCGGP